MISLQVMALQGVYTVNLTSKFPIPDEMMSEVTIGQSIIENGKGLSFRINIYTPVNSLEGMHRPCQKQIHRGFQVKTKY